MQAILGTRIKLTPANLEGTRLAQKDTIWEVVQVDKEAQEVLLEALNAPSPKHPKKLATAMWVKAGGDPRFIFWREV